MSLSDVIAALVALFETVATTFDGPKPTSDRPTTYILVGSSGEDDDDMSADLALSDIGPGTWWDESGEVVCSVWSWTGDSDITVPRAAALDAFEDCRALVSANRALGLPLNGLAQTTGVRLRQQQTSAGAICRVVFTVTYRTTQTD